MFMEKPEIEIIEFNSTDVIVTSNEPCAEVGTDKCPKDVCPGNFDFPED